MPLPPSALSACVALLSVSLLACSSGSNPLAGDGAGANGANTQNGIAGLWKGTLDNIGKSAPADHKPSSITATIKTDDSGQNGTFAFALINDPTAKTEGKFTLFANQKMQLDVASSSLSLLGAAGDASNLDYVLSGRSLELSNDRVDMLLTRQDGNGATGAPNGGDSNLNDGNPLSGKYTCTDQNRQQWRIDFTSESSFSGNVVGLASGSSTVWFNGNIADDPSGTYKSILTITDSLQGAYNDVKIGAAINSDKTVAMYLLPDGQSRSNMACDRDK
jgi:hypothetical protein